MNWSAADNPCKFSGTFSRHMLLFIETIRESPYEMSANSAERRRSKRGAASHAARVYSANGLLLAEGKTSNISENGVLVVAKIMGAEPQNGGIVLELAVPDASSKPSRRGRSRTVRFDAQIIRTVRLGHLVGVGIEFKREL